MKRKIVSGIMLTLLFIGMLTLAFNIQPAKAWTGGTIYIRADGSVDPSTAPISSVDNVTYTFTDNITIDIPLTYPDGIVVQKDNIIVDGAGYTIQGARARYSKVISLSGRNNITIKNMKIRVFGQGIYLYGSSNNNISGNNITGSWAWGCEGIWLDESSNNNIISGNNLRNNHEGISLEYSSNNTISGNVMNGNVMDFRFYGSTLSHFMHSIDVSNLADGKPVYYLVNQKNLAINPATYSEIGYLALINSTNITVEGLTLTNKGHGLFLAYTNNSLITGNNLISNVTSVGIYLHCSSNNTISENNVATNSWYAGIALISCIRNATSGNNITQYQVGARSSNNMISGNNITNNDWGIDLNQGSTKNTVSGNTITNNRGIGIRLERYSDKNTVSGNIITNNGRYGIVLESSNNTISGNNITDNNYGILVYGSSNNIYHNNFINNTQQVSIYRAAYTNFWDNGYPSGGNYWSDHACTGNPSNGSQPYIIDANNVDHYPFQDPNGWVILGDINGDGIVDIQDVVIAALAFGSASEDDPTTPWDETKNWNLFADLNNDGFIDIVDLVIIGINFGKTCKLNIFCFLNNRLAFKQTIKEPVKCLSPTQQEGVGGWG